MNRERTLVISLAIALGGLLLYGCVACEHTDPDRTTAATAARVEPVKAPKPSPAIANRCLVPLADPPPPRAFPSTTCPADPDGPMKLAHAWVAFTDAPGAPRVAVEVADTDRSRERGLMYRTHLGEDEGMLFDWPDEATRMFWMHNTCIPLDMLYIAADGTILGVVEQAPPMNDSSRGVPCPVAHVLELNAGFVRAHGVTPGQRIHIDS